MPVTISNQRLGPVGQYSSIRGTRRLDSTRRLVDTGSGVSIMTFSAFNRVALQTGVALQPHRIDLYAANGKTMKTFGIAERVRFQPGGYELEAYFLVEDDAYGLEDFLLGLRA